MMLCLHTENRLVYYSKVVDFFLLQEHPIADRSGPRRSCLRFPYTTAAGASPLRIGDIESFFGSVDRASSEPPSDTMFFPR